ncbi:MAG: ribosome maturation factor RimM [Bacteroidia bacterium]|nr:ribosome maturation factor RimM [Bacteroidia bacterium]
MAYNNNILLGRITKVNGYEGAVTVKLEKLFSENIPQMESVFLEIEGRSVPFFISDSEYTGADILKLKFEGYDSIEKISEFTGCRVFLTTSSHASNQTEDIQSLKGYKVLIQGNIILGSITEVIPNPGQWMLNIISAKNKDVLIPFHEHFIVNIDKKKKIIVMNIPEGLTEIN